MKQWFITFTGFLFFIQIQGQVTTIQDKAFKKQLIESGITIDSSGKINNRTSKISYLVLSDPEIKNLQGLEVFKDLRSLELNGLQITELPDLKFAPFLETLIIKNCPRLESIRLYENKELLDVELNATALKEIDLSFSGKLKTFQFENNADLLFVNIANGTASFDKGMMQIEVTARNNPSLEIVLIDDSINPDIGKIPYGYEEWREDYLLVSQRKTLVASNKNTESFKQ